MGELFETLSKLFPDGAWKEFKMDAAPTSVVNPAPVTWPYLPYITEPVTIPVIYTVLFYVPPRIKETRTL